jgi:hypothetical protein
MAGKIFINYRWHDSAPHALAVAQYFENQFAIATSSLMSTACGRG